MSPHSARIVAFVPARGGSKGVPGKNLKPIGGVPLVARAIAAALCTEYIDRVVVSTDDPEIERLALAEGADVVLRPAELSGDTATSESALLHALDAIGWAVDVVVFLQATSPFIRPSDLDGAVAQVVAGDKDVVFSATESHGFLWRKGDDTAVGVNHDPAFRLRRQDREPEYLETGAFYVMDAAGFRRAGFRFFGRIGIAEVAALGAVEIDTPDDLMLAESLEPLLDGRIAAAVPPTATAASPAAVGTIERNRPWTPSSPEYPSAPRTPSM